MAPNGHWCSNKSLAFLSAFFLYLWMIGSELSSPLEVSWVEMHGQGECSAHVELPGDHEACWLNLLPSNPVLTS